MCYQSTYILCFVLCEELHYVSLGYGDWKSQKFGYFKKIYNHDYGWKDVGMYLFFQDALPISIENY